MEAPEQKPKSSHAEREERILSFWNEKGIFQKSLDKDAPQGEFVFYEGPPTANGRPGIHHLEARAFKDAIPRYKTMRGFHVRRKGGWDTHGLPVEIQVQKELGLKSKKDIEAYGLEAFNEKCKESVWTYVHEWEDFTKRMGYWVDLKDPYITYKPDYMESLWNIMKTVDDKGLLYKDYRVVPWCPHDETVLSSHELAQGYETVKDLSVYVKFKVKKEQERKAQGASESQEYLLAWTTTPWTLPGNVALAVGASIAYVKIKIGNDSLILAKDRLSVIKDPYEIEGELTGSQLIAKGLEYEPLYPFLKDNVTGAEKEKLANAFKVYAADFVTTADGTGIVHIAPMYGQDDFELGTKANLPKHHLVNEDGTFKSEVGFLAGKFVKSEETDVEIIKNLANRPTGSLLFHKEKHEHTYPFCWRCKTPLIYFARDSWYIRMSSLRNTLVKENESIHWEPEHIQEGRFGEWLREVKDWAISRERYWGTPLPVWICETCKKRKVAGSVADVSKKPKNTYYVMRHGEAENNILGILSGDPKAPHHLTAKGREQVAKAAESLGDKKIDLVFASPFVRTEETLAILKEKIGWKDDQIETDPRIREIDSGSWNGRKVSDYVKHFNHVDHFNSRPDHVENFADMKKRMGDFLYDIESKNEGKTILIITHESPAHLLVAAAGGLDRRATVALRENETREFLLNAEVRKLDFAVIPHNHEYELDLHRPYIDEVTLPCACGGEMKRVKEVMDVWFDSGAMPFAQEHYPFKEQGVRSRKQGVWARLFSTKQKLPYPADFISEAIDQTRGWFYTLHAIGALMGKGKAFKNVICLGHILDAEGKKMSKSVGNVVDPWSMMDKYGADALRFWMYSINQPGDSKNFDEKTVDDVIKKVFNLVTNVTAFYKMYEAGSRKQEVGTESQNVLDQWIIAKLNQLIENVTRNLDAYALMEPTRAIRDFIADLSQWYVRRSRDRFKEEGADKEAALQTTQYVLLTLAKVMAPFTPFFAEELYQNAGGELESVHLEEWPIAGKVDQDILDGMIFVRSFVTIALMQRTENKIPVRQPLQKLLIKHNGSEPKYWSELREVLKDEVNVREIFFDPTITSPVQLDFTITPELKEEGDVRELVRKIQDMRKEKGLSVGDKATLVATEDMRAIISKNESAIKKLTGLNAIEFGASLELKA